MPWRLEKIFDNDDKPYFVFDRSVPFEVQTRSRGRVPPKEYWPMKIAQVTDHEVIPDYVTGPSTSWLLVSKRFKDLVEAWDPVAHIFVPVEVAKKDGTVLHGQHFFFYPQGDIEGGIDLERSDVYKKVLEIKGGGEIVYYVNKLEPPILCWFRSKIRGRHLWSDPMFKEAVVVSDEFYSWLKRHKIAGYQAQECLVTEDEV